MRYLIATIIVIAIHSQSALHAQAWKQVFPSYDVDDYTGITCAGRDTLYITGTNFLLQRSVDGGVNWTTLYHKLGAMDLWDSGYDGRTLWLLPSGKPYYDELARDSTHMFLLKYDPESDDTTRISMPVPDAPRSQFSLFVTPKALFVVQGSVKYNRIYRSVDRGDSWSHSDLPDTLSLMKMLFRNEHDGLFIFYSYNTMVRCLYTTRDGGLTFKRHDEIRFNDLYDQRHFGYPMSWIDDTTAIVVPETNIPYISHDGGDTWISTNATVPAQIASVSIGRTGTGYICGRDFEVLRTADFGSTWTMVRGPSAKYNYHTMAMGNDSTVTMISSVGDRISTTDGGMTWNNDQLNPYTDFYPEQLLDNDVLYARATLSDKFVTVVRIRSTDGGRTWNPFQCSNPLLRQFIHTSGNTSYAVPGSFTPNGSVIMKSIDGGVTWTDCLLDTLTGFSDADVRAISNMHRGDDTVFVAFRDKGSLVATTNGGASWSLHAIPRFTMMNMRYHACSWGITDSLVMRSSDDGVTWTPVFTLPSDAVAFRKIVVFSGESVAALSQRVHAAPYNVTGYVHRSTDGGSTWTSNPIHTFTDVLTTDQTVPFLTAEGLGYIISGSANMQGGNRYSLYVTTDFWDTYSSRYILSSTVDAHRMMVLDKDKIWLITSNRIYSTASGGIDAIEPPSLPVRNGLAQNYPNPFSSVTRIPFRIADNTVRHATLELFDIMGRKVKTLLDDVMNPGEHTIPLSSAGLRPGIYFLRLTIGGQFEMRKMILR